MANKTLYVMSKLSTEFVPFQVRFYGVDDPTGFTVQAAFTAPDVDPVAEDWKVASWDPIGGPPFFMRCLVGPDGGTVTLAEGEYDAWAKISAGSETIVEEAGQLSIR